MHIAYKYFLYTHLHLWETLIYIYEKWDSFHYLLPITWYRSFFLSFPWWKFITKVKILFFTFFVFCWKLHISPLIPHEFLLPLWISCCSCVLQQVFLLFFVICFFVHHASSESTWHWIIFLRAINWRTELSYCHLTLGWF